MANSEKFSLFWNGPFSQWTYSPFVVDSIAYNCAEQFMMAQKARTFGDNEALMAIMATEDPALQKQLGREVKGYSDEVWQAIQDNGRPLCWNVVFVGSAAKYEQNAELRDELLATAGTTIVEASPVDRVWGIGWHESDPEALDRSKWRGDNWLGEVLTELRDRLLQ